MNEQGNGVEFRVRNIERGHAGLRASVVNDAASLLNTITPQVKTVGHRRTFSLP